MISFGKKLMKIIILILCSIGSSDVNGEPTPLKESRLRQRIMFMGTADFNLTEGALLNFLQFGVEKLQALLGIEPTTLELSSQLALSFICSGK